jgi:hypothetical protein
VSFAAITLYVASQQVFILLLFISLPTQSGKFWIHPRILTELSISDVEGSSRPRPQLGDTMTHLTDTKFTGSH